MPEINIDDLCEPIEVTVGGKTYTVEDISRETAKKMSRITEKSDEIKVRLEKATRLMQDAEKTSSVADVEKAAEQITELNKEFNNVDNFEELSVMAADMLNADKAEIAKLGMRKLMRLIKELMGTINEELEGKNVPKVVATK